MEKIIQENYKREIMAEAKLLLSKIADYELYYGEDITNAAGFKVLEQIAEADGVAQDYAESVEFGYGSANY